MTEEIISVPLSYFVDEFHNFEAVTKKPLEIVKSFGLGHIPRASPRAMLHEDYFVDGWNVFDYCLVVFSVADLDT